MALDQRAYPVQGSLIDLGDTPANYTSAGTSLGAANSPVAVGLSRQATPVTRTFDTTRGLTPYGVRHYGDAVSIDVILYERSEKVLELLYAGNVTNLGYAVNTAFRPGHLIRHDHALIKHLMFRSSMDTKPSWLIPAAFPISIQRAQVYHPEQDLLNATVITLIGLAHPDFGNRGYLDGDPDDWPEWPGGE